MRYSDFSRNVNRFERGGVTQRRGLDEADHQRGKSEMFPRIDIPHNWRNRYALPTGMSAAAA
jgi:hypothetical protein